MTELPRLAETGGCGNAPILKQRGQREVFCGLTGIIGCIVRCRTPSFWSSDRAPVRIFCNPQPG